MAERKNAKALACRSLQERTNVNLDVPLQGRSAPFTVVLSIRVGSHRRSDGSLVLLITLKIILSSTNVLSRVRGALPWRKVDFFVRIRHEGPRRWVLLLLDKIKEYYLVVSWHM